MPSQSPIRLANDRIELRLDPGSGRILAVRNKISGLDLISSVLDTPPWRIEVERQEAWLARFTRFTCEPEPGLDPAVRLRWETEYGLTVTSRVWLPSNDGPSAGPSASGDSIRLTCAVENASALPLDKLEYPILSGIGPLVSPQVALREPERAHTCLVHSQGTGFLYRDPLRTFLPEPGPRQGLRYSPYPDGFSGSTMQFMAYYAEDQGGFYFAARDSGRTVKWLNFYKDVSTAALAATIMHQAPHVAPGLSFDPGYEIEIRCLYQGDWYEAAGRYKTWAVQQPWTARGRLAGNPERPRWLFEEVGACTFGVNAAYDRSAWLEAFHKISGRPMLHVLGPNWAPAGQDYLNHIPGGVLEDWLPPRFSEENLSAIRRSGDYWVPFEFDLLCSHSGERDAPVLECRQVLPERKYSFDRYGFPFMCPATGFWHNFHVQRDTGLARAASPDGIYYDISANNLLMDCRSRSHNHPPAGGPHLIAALGSLFAETKAAISAVAGRPMPVGTEMISEQLIPFIDFYQARAEAGPLGGFEGDFWRAWVLDGRAEKIPLFAYVYHEYGPVRLDGWAKLAAEAGDLFYWTAARVVLWGGILELNYEFTGLEALDGLTDDPGEHYYPFDPRDYAIDPAKAAFVREAAEARAGWGSPYLAYGTMLRPPRLSVPAVDLDYYFYNAGKDIRAYEERGALAVPSVLCSAWREPGGSRTPANSRAPAAAVFLANLLPEPQTIDLPLDPRALGFDGAGPVEIAFTGSGGSQPLGTPEDASILTLTLPPRRIVAVEVRPAGDHIRHKDTL